MRWLRGVLFRTMIVVTWWPMLFASHFAAVVMFVLTGRGSGPTRWFERHYMSCSTED